MSLENHPNFHAVKFATRIIGSYFECLRGKADHKTSPNITDEVAEFVNKIEEKVDNFT